MEDLYRTLEIDKRRRYNGVTGDLFTLEDIEEKIWTCEVPTVVSRFNFNYPFKVTYVYKPNRNYNLIEPYRHQHHLHSLHSKIDILLLDSSIRNNYYNIQLMEKYPFLLAFKQQGFFENILLAGGSVQGLLYEWAHGSDWYSYGTYSFSENQDDYPKYHRDLDFFFYNTTSEQALHLIKEVVECIGSKYLHCCYQNENSFTLIIGPYKEMNNNCKYFTLQFIFRIYSSVSEILHGFDLGSSAVGFDGSQVYFTSLSKFCYEYKCNIVDTSRRSTSYEYRLKKYLMRGFNIILPRLTYYINIKHDNIQPIHLPYLNILENDAIKSVDININFPNETTIGFKHCLYSGHVTIGDHDTSDYSNNSLSDQVMKITDYDDNILNKIHFRNLYYLTRNKIESILCINVNPNDTLQFYYNYYTFITTFYDKFLEKFDRYKQLTSDLKPSDFIDKRKLQESYQLYKDLSRYVLYLIRPVFIENLTYRLINESRSCVYERLRQHNNSNKKINWITKTPGTQLTSSINPIIEDEWKWYGLDHYDPSQDLLTDMVISACLGRDWGARGLWLFYSGTTKEYDWLDQNTTTESRRKLTLKDKPQDLTFNVGKLSF